jgi:hypothetical protein
MAGAVHIYTQFWLSQMVFTTGGTQNPKASNDSQLDSNQV